MEFDIGNNLSSIAVFWLILKYILPVLIGLFIILVVVTGTYISLKTIDWDNLPEYLQYLFGIMALGFVIILLILT